MFLLIVSESRKLMFPGARDGKKRLTQLVSGKIVLCPGFLDVTGLYAFV